MLLRKSVDKENTFIAFMEKQSTHQWIYTNPCCSIGNCIANFFEI